MSYLLATQCWDPGEQRWMGCGDGESCFGEDSVPTTTAEAAAVAADAWAYYVQDLERFAWATPWARSFTRYRRMWEGCDDSDCHEAFAVHFEVQRDPDTSEPIGVELGEWGPLEL